MELKPCPFCGGQVELFDDGDDWYMFSCNKCEIIYQTSFGEVSDEANGLAITEYNQRPIEDALQAEIDALKADIIRQSKELVKAWNRR